MRLFAERQTAIGKRAYWYTFTHEPPIEPGARDLKATHAAEIVYALNNLWAPRVFPDSSSPKLAMASEKDKAVAELMSSYWVNFARTGDPNGNARRRRESNAAAVGAVQGPQRAAARHRRHQGIPGQRDAQCLRRQVRRGDEVADDGHQLIGSSP